ARNAIPAELVSAFARDGAGCGRGRFSADEIAQREHRIEENLAHPSADALIASRDDDPGRFFEDFCNWRRIAAYRRFLAESPVAAAA
ncbi:phytanoyl-CoA dioxygenase, partial [Pseudomonas aeruginosa]